LGGTSRDEKKGGAKGRAARRDILPAKWKGLLFGQLINMPASYKIIGKIN